MVRRIVPVPLRGTLQAIPVTEIDAAAPEVGERRPADLARV